MIEIITATVYKVNGRRCLTKSTAIHRWANSLYFKKYPCECESETNYVCPNHRGNEATDRVLERLERRFKKRMGWYRDPR